jgi:hypothetical protein
MFQAVQQVLKTLTTCDTRLGGEAGFTAMLPTSARNLDFHLHIRAMTGQIREIPLQGTVSSCPKLKTSGKKKPM